MPTMQPETNQFRIIKCIGKGSYGKVYAVHHAPSNQILAMKQMSKALVAQSRDQFCAIREEKRVLGATKSPFHTTLHSAFQTSTDLYIVMPYMCGGDMFCHFEELDNQVEIVPESWLRFYAAQIVLAVEDLHRMNTVYRDLKPENLLIGSDGHLRLSDFGLSIELLHENNYLTKGRSGTRGYQAPEVMTGEPYGFSPDFYGLGMVLIWMFQGHSDVEQFRASDVSPHTPLSPAGRELILSLTQDDPAKRLTSWHKVRNHPWFKSIDFAALYRRQTPPPFIPRQPRLEDMEDELRDDDEKDIIEFRATSASGRLPPQPDSLTRLFQKMGFRVALPPSPPESPRSLAPSFAESPR